MKLKKFVIVKHIQDNGKYLFYVPKEYQDSVMNAFRDLLYIPFEFESNGTRIIHYSPEDYVPRE